MGGLLPPWMVAGARRGGAARVWARTARTALSVEWAVCASQRAGVYGRGMGVQDKFEDNSTSTSVSLVCLSHPHTLPLPCSILWSIRMALCGWGGSAGWGGPSRWAAKLPHWACILQPKESCHTRAYSGHTVARERAISKYHYTHWGPESRTEALASHTGGSELDTPKDLPRRFSPTHAHSHTPAMCVFGVCACTCYA